MAILYFYLNHHVKCFLSLTKKVIFWQSFKICQKKIVFASLNDNCPGGKGKKHDDDADMERTPTLNTH